MSSDAPGKIKDVKIPSMSDEQIRPGRAYSSFNSIKLIGL